MPPSVAFVLGLLVGLAVGALVVAGIVRATSRITGAAPRSLPGLVLGGLRPGGPADGVAAQRALARRLKRTGQRTAAGRRVAATTLEVHVSPEDHTAIDEAMGLEAAQTDLTDFYTGHASRAGWLVGSAPQLSIVRDISLRPRQSFVRAETRADPSNPLLPAGPTPAAPRASAARQEARPQQARPAPDARAPVAPQQSPAAQPEDAALTDVLPRGLFDQAAVDQDALQTAAYPLGMAEQAVPGDLLVVHGTDVRVVPVRRGLATVGRAAHNDVVVAAPGVADDHLLLEHRQRGWWVVPGPSKARVTLEGRAVKTAERLEGQGVVELGRGARLRLSVEPDR